MKLTMGKEGYEQGGIHWNGKIWPSKYKIVGKLHKTGRTFKGKGVGKRRIYADETGQEWAKAFGKWWKFPQEVEY